MLAALHAIAALLESGTSLSALLAPFNRYHLSGEINTEVSDPRKAIARIKEIYRAESEPVEFDELDGLTVSSRDWWFNLRPSNTEPLLRLNVEAQDSKTLEAVKSQVLRLVINQ
jgi:phosphomannomutase